ncbi:MAG: CdaR family protein [Myxococcales bacterium]|nr:CdaR family protein [Myxococcales bacterium]
MQPGKSASIRGLIRLLTDNLGLKALSLVLAVLLFSLVHSDVDAQRSLYLDVVALLPEADANRMLVSELPTQVKVTVRGSRSLISSISRDDLPPLQMDLRDGSIGYYYFDASDVELPGAAQVVEMTPSMVSLDWAQSASRPVAVRPRLEGELRRGLQLRSGIVVEPAVIAVRGPADVVGDLKAVSTAAVAVDGLDAGHHSRRVPLQPLPEHVTYEGESSVEVRLRVEPVVEERELKRLRVEAIGANVGALRPERVSITLRGPENLLSELDPETLVPYIEIPPEAPAGMQPYPVQLRGLPEGLTLLAIAPESVLARAKAAAQ